MNHTVRKKLLGAAFFLAVFVLTAWSVFHDENPAQIAHYLDLVNNWYLLPAAACVLAFILGESMIIHYLMRSLGTKVRMSHCCLYSFIGFFYSAITPSASGGQPMQVLAMRRDGIPTAISTVVLAIITIIYKSVLIVLGIAVLLMRPQAVMLYLEPVEELVYLGLVLNVICVTCLLLAVFIPGAIRYPVERLLAAAKRLGLLKNPEKLEERISRLLDQYHSTAAYFRQHPVIIANVFVVTMLQRMFYFCVIWFAYRAFGLSGHSPATLILLYSMISVAVDMMPLPGGMGISETMFEAIFEPIFTEAIVIPGMIISRGICYYSQLLVCGFFTLISRYLLRPRK